MFQLRPPKSANREDLIPYTYEYHATEVLKVQKDPLPGLSYSIDLTRHLLLPASSSPSANTFGGVGEEILGYEHRDEPGLAVDLPQQQLSNDGTVTQDDDAEQDQDHADDFLANLEKEAEKYFVHKQEQVAKQEPDQEHNNKENDKLEEQQQDKTLDEKEEKKEFDKEEQEEKESMLPPQQNEVDQQKDEVNQQKEERQRKEEEKRHSLEKYSSHGIVKEYCMPMKNCHLSYHGLTPEHTKNNLDENSDHASLASTDVAHINPPVRTIAIRIRPDVLCGAVMDAIYYVLDDMSSEIQKRQGGHLKAAIYSDNQNSTTPYDVDAQLCTYASPNCERMLLIRIFHASKQTLQGKQSETHGGRNASVDAFPSSPNINELGLDDDVQFLLSGSPPRQEQKQEEALMDHQHNANLHLREACALIQRRETSYFAKKVQLLQMPNDVEVEVEAEAEVQARDSHAVETAIEPEGETDTDTHLQGEIEDNASKTEADVTTITTTNVDTEACAKAGEEIVTNEVTDEEVGPKSDEETKPEQDEETKPKTESELKSGISVYKENKKLMSLAQRCVSSYLLQHYLASPSVLDADEKDGSRVTLPSLSPKDWPVICTSWTLIKKIWEELQDRQLTYASLWDSSFGTFPALPTIDVQYCAQLKTYSRKQMIEQLALHQAELEQYAQQQEMSTYHGWKSLSEAEKLYNIQLPDRPNALSIESYPLDFVPHQDTCPPWGGKVMEAMNLVAAMSHGDQQQALKTKFLELPQSLQSPKSLEAEVKRRETLSSNREIGWYSESPSSVRDSCNSLDLAEKAVQLVWMAFQKQHDEEQSARLNRKNSQIMDRLARMQAHQRKCVELFATCTDTNAIQAADEFFAKIQPDKLTDISSRHDAVKEVPLLKCGTLVGGSTPGHCYITSTQILLTTTKWMPMSLLGGGASSRRSTLFLLQEIDLQVVESHHKSRMLSSVSRVISVQKDGKEVYTFQPSWISAQCLKSLVDTLKKLASEDPLVFPDRSEFSMNSSKDATKGQDSMNSSKDAGEGQEQSNEENSNEPLPTDAQSN